MQCARCTEDVPPARIRRRAKFCSNLCADITQKEKYREINRRPGDLQSGTVGAIHELEVACDLLRMGYEVFRAMSPSCSCDLAILKDGKLLRVEVTTGYRAASGRIQHPHANRAHRYDIVAIIVQGRIVYQPEFVEPAPFRPSGGHS